MVTRRSQRRATCTAPPARLVSTRAQLGERIAVLAVPVSSARAVRRAAVAVAVALPVRGVCNQARVACSALQAGTAQEIRRRAHIASRAAQASSKPATASRIAMHATPVSTNQQPVQVHVSIAIPASTAARARPHARLAKAARSRKCPGHRSVQRVWQVNTAPARRSRRSAWVAPMAVLVRALPAGARPVRRGRSATGVLRKPAVCIALRAQAGSIRPTADRRCVNHVPPAGMAQADPPPAVVAASAQPEPGAITRVRAVRYVLLASTGRLCQPSLISRAAFIARQAKTRPLQERRTVTHAPRAAISPRKASHRVSRVHRESTVVAPAVLVVSGARPADSRQAGWHLSVPRARRVRGAYRRVSIAHPAHRADMVLHCRRRAVIVKTVQPAVSSNFRARHSANRDSNAYQGRTKQTAQSVQRSVI